MMNKKNKFMITLILGATTVAAYSSASEGLPQNFSSASSFPVSGNTEIYVVDNPVQPVSRPFVPTQSAPVSSGGYRQPEEGGGIEPALPQRDLAPATNFPEKPLSLPAPMTRLEPKHENGVTYLCGGIGLEEASYMKQNARNYDLILTFAVRAGNYLADVNVDISDSKGQSVLRANCEAPMMLVSLPHTGTYRIHAETGGQTITRAIDVQAKRTGKAVTMVWPGQ